MVSNVLIWCPLGPEGFRLYQGPPYIGVGQNPFYSKVPDWEISGHHLLLVPKIVAYFRCLFFIMSVHSHICTYSTYILNTYIHNDLWQCICVLMICFLAKKIITLYPVRVRISLKKTQPGRRPGCVFFFWNLPFGQVSFFFSETCLRRGCVFFGRFLSRFRFLSEVSFLIYSRIRMTEALFSQLFVQTLSSYFRVLSSFFKTIFDSNYYKWLVLKLVHVLLKPTT